MAGGLEAKLLAPGLWGLGGHHIRVYLLRGEYGAALFEVGISATTPLVLAQLASLGVEPEEVRLLVMSHAHSDHATGQIGLLEALPRAELVLGQASADYLAKPATAQHFAEEEALTSPEVSRREGLPAPLPPYLTGPLLPPADRMRLARAGESLDLGGLTLALHDAAGHVPGGFWGFIPELGAALASDSAGFGHPNRPGFPLYFVSYRQYMDTLQDIGGMIPAILGLGHQLCLEGQKVRDYLAATRELMETEHRAVLDGHAAGRVDEDLAEDIFDRHYHDELTVYSPASILDCCRLLVRRSREAAGVECLDSH